MLFLKLKKSTQIILVIQAISMLGASFTHIFWIWEHGVLSDDYNAPIMTRVFWDSLAVLDLLAAFLLILRPKSGLILTFLIITLDVFHNNIFYFSELYDSQLHLTEWIRTYWMIFGQIAFLIFVYSTFRCNFAEIKLKSEKF